LPLFIPGLPEHLAWCPDGPTGTDIPVDGFSFPIDRDRSVKVRSWEVWAEGVLTYRTERWKAILSGDPKEIARERYLLEQTKDPCYFILIWCSVYETRQENIDAIPWGHRYGTGWLPAIMHPRQIEYVKWLYTMLRSRGHRANGATRKSREVGATTFVMLERLWEFLYTTPFSVKFLSREEAVADNIGDIDSMMERVTSLIIPDPDQFNPVIPGALLPPFKPSHRKFKMLRRPGNRNRMIASSTNKRATRGGRARVVDIDEAAHMDAGLLSSVNTAVMSTAPHVHYLSSESVENSEEFILICDKMAEEDLESVFIFEWWMHLYHDSAWLTEDMLKRYQNDMAGFYREVLRDAYRGFEGWMYPEARNLVLRDEYAHPRDYPDARIYVGIDPGTADDCACGWLMKSAEADVMLEAYQTNGKPPEFYAAIMIGLGPDELTDDPVLRNIYWDDRTIDLIHRIRTFGPPKALCGDPTGKNENTVGDSWYSKMMKFWKKNWYKSLSFWPDWDGRIPIRINWKPDARADQGRRNSLHAWLLSGKLSFNDTPLVEAALTALQKSRWDPSERPRQSEQKNARHDDYSHMRTMIEYLSVNQETSTILEDRGRAAPLELSNHGYALSSGSADGAPARNARAAPLTIGRNARTRGSVAAVAAYHATNGSRRRRNDGSTSDGSADGYAAPATPAGTSSA
jgi:hypothetical protein